MLPRDVLSLCQLGQTDQLRAACGHGRRARSLLLRGSWIYTVSSSVDKLYLFLNCTKPLVMDGALFCMVLGSVNIVALRCPERSVVLLSVVVHGHWLNITP